MPSLLTSIAGGRGATRGGRDAWGLEGPLAGFLTITLFLGLVAASVPCARARYGMPVSCVARPVSCMLVAPRWGLRAAVAWRAQHHTSLMPTHPTREPPWAVWAATTQHYEEMNGPQGTGGVHGVTGATAGSIGQQARTWGNLVSRGSVGIFYPIFWVKVGCF